METNYIRGWMFGATGITTPDKNTTTDFERGRLDGRAARLHAEAVEVERLKNERRNASGPVSVETALAKAKALR